MVWYLATDCSTESSSVIKYTEEQTENQFHKKPWDFSGTSNKPDSAALNSRTVCPVLLTADALFDLGRRKHSTTNKHVSIIYRSTVNSSRRRVDFFFSPVSQGFFFFFLL